MRDLYSAVEDVAAALVTDTEPTDEDYGRAVSLAYEALCNYRDRHPCPLPPPDTNRLVGAALNVKFRHEACRKVTTKPK